MQRCFFAIPIPEDVGESLLAVARSHLLTTFDSSNFHLTLSFLGDVGEDFIGEAIAVCSEAKLPKPSIECDRWSSATVSQGDILFAECAELSRASLVKVKTSIDANLSVLGFHETKPVYRPHISVGYVKPPLESDVRNPTVYFEPSEWHLYTSKSNFSGGPYKVRHSFKFC